LLLEEQLKAAPATKGQTVRSVARYVALLLLACTSEATFAADAGGTWHQEEKLQ
jgi:hypothetical protein